jgi:hypothetical protein
MIAFVRGVSAAATASGSSHGSVVPTTSAKTGVAPVYATALTVATKVIEGTTTSSPGPRPAAAQARCSAAVPLVTARAWRAPVKAANSRSNASVSGPMLNHPER